MVRPECCMEFLITCRYNPGMSPIEQLNTWLKENQGRIAAARTAAMLRIPGLAEAMCDPDLTGEAAIRERAERIGFNSRAVLPDLMEEAFEEEFEDVGEELRRILVERALEVTHGNMDTFLSAKRKTAVGVRLIRG